MPPAGLLHPLAALICQCTDAAGELRSAGLSAAGIEGDLGAAGDMTPPEDMADDMPEDGTAPPVAPAGPATPPAA